MTQLNHKFTALNYLHRLNQSINDTIDLFDHFQGVMDWADEDTKNFLRGDLQELNALILQLEARAKRVWSDRKTLDEILEQNRQQNGVE